ncbi:MAG: hypothetical protein WC628_03290 [Candidatus Omnitrophota bacterium]
MTTPGFRKTFFISLAGHIAAFSFFSFSFGYKLQNANYAAGSFWGQLLPSYQLRPYVLSKAKQEKVFSFASLPLPAVHRQAQNLENQLFLASDVFIKPAPQAPGVREKQALKDAFKELNLPVRRKDAFILLHPLLPYSFVLYFKDRQSAHVELAFNLVNNDSGRYILVKRKISSGNLEVDLLAMRYIEHYLFIQQAKFAQNSWQSVKIELSANSD